jgi:hypothetical protein
VLRELGMPLSDMVLKAVASSGRLNILQHLLTEQHCPSPVRLSYYAARSGCIGMLKWLRAQGWGEFSRYTCEGAAAGGQLAALQHLRSEGCDWNAEYIACDAASSGSIEVVEWLRQQQGIEINTEVLAWAASTGQTAMCAHLRSIGCDWDADACCYCAESGRLETLRWLREQGCPWVVSEVLIGAALFGHTDIVDYVIEQGEVQAAELLTAALNHAGGSNKLQTAQRLRQHGAEWPAVLSFSVGSLVRQWSDESLAWARAEGCTSPTAV